MRAVDECISDFLLDGSDACGTLIIHPERNGTELELPGICRLQVISASLVAQTPDAYNVLDKSANTHELTVWRRHVLTLRSQLIYVRRLESDHTYVESATDALNEAIEQKQTGDVLGGWQKYVCPEVHHPGGITIKVKRTMVTVAVFERPEWATETREAIC